MRLMEGPKSEKAESSVVPSSRCSSVAGDN